MLLTGQDEWTYYLWPYGVSVLGRSHYYAVQAGNPRPYTAVISAGGKYQSTYTWSYFFHTEQALIDAGCIEVNNLHFRKE